VAKEQTEEDLKRVLLQRAFHAANNHHAVDEVVRLVDAYVDIRDGRAQCRGCS
jgi:hypothetical protein